VKVIENAVVGTLSASEATARLQLGQRRCNGESGAAAPTPWLGCSMAIANGPFPIWELAEPLSTFFLLSFPDMR
jgi:hypothetical protein